MMNSNEKTKLDHYAARDLAHPLNSFYEGEENFDGLITHERKCTDVTCLIIFILMNTLVVLYSYKGSAIYNLIRVIRESDWRRLYKETDFRTDFCGHNQLSNETAIYFYDPEAVGPVGICVNNCPIEKGLDICFYNEFNNETLDDYCFKTYSTSKVGFYCMPLDMKDIRRYLIELETKSLVNSIKYAATDIWRLKDIVLISYGVMLFTGFLMIFLFLIKKRSFIFIIIFLLFGFGFIGGCLFYMNWEQDKYLKKYCFEAKNENNCANKEIFFLTVTYYTILGLSAFFLIGLLCYIKRMKVLAGVLEFEAQKIRMAVLFLYLLGHYLTAAVISIGFLFVFISAMCSGNVMTVDAPSAFPNPYIRKIVIDEINYYGLIYIAFMYLWWLQIINNVGKFVISGARSTLYFSKAKQILNRPISRSLKYAIFKNFGSIIMISIIVFIVWPWRALTFRIKQRLLKYHDKTVKSFKFFLNFCSPFLNIYESHLKFMRSKNIMQIVVFGDSFLRAGQKLFFLRLRNETRLAFFKNKLGFIRLIGDILIPGSGAFFIYSYCFFREETFLGENMSEAEHRFITPIIIFFSGLSIANIFSGFYDQLIESSLFSFISDEEMFTGYHRFAEPETRLYMDSYGKESDDSRNLANTKVNPFNYEKDKETVKYDPLKTKYYANKNSPNMFGNLGQTEEMSENGSLKFETSFDPVNNRMRYKSIFDEETKMESWREGEGGKSRSRGGTPLTPEKSRGETPLTPEIPSMQLPNSLPHNNFLNDKPPRSSKIRPSPSNSNQKIESVFDFQANPSLFDPYSKKGEVIKDDNLRLNDFSKNNSEYNSVIEEEHQRSFIDLERMSFDDIQNFSKNEESKSHVSNNNSFSSLNQNQEERRERLKNFEEKLKSINNSNIKQDGHAGKTDLHKKGF